MLFALESKISNSASEHQQQNLFRSLASLAFCFLPPETLFEVWKRTTVVTEMREVSLTAFSTLCDITKGSTFWKGINECKFLISQELILDSGFVLRPLDEVIFQDFGANKQNLNLNARIDVAAKWVSAAAAE